MGIFDENTTEEWSPVAYRSHGCQSRYLAGSVSQKGRWRRKGERRVRESTGASEEWGRVAGGRCGCERWETGTSEGAWLALHSEPRWSIVETSLPSFSFSRCVSLISLPPRTLLPPPGIGYARISHPLSQSFLSPFSPPPFPRIPSTYFSATLYYSELPFSLSFCRGSLFLFNANAQNDDLELCAVFLRRTNAEYTPRDHRYLKL